MCRLWVLLILSAINAASAAEEKGVMMGFGVQSCAQFAKDYRESPEPVEMLHFGWAQGYMSGLNSSLTLLKQPTHDLNSWNISDQKLFLRKYCERKPLSSYVEGVLELFQKFPATMPKSN